MREAAFVKQNKEKWIVFEKAIAFSSKISPDELADQYIHLTNDLAYAQTYYQETKMLLYLNSLASKAHQKIYKKKKVFKIRIVNSWRVEFPFFFHQHHKPLFYSFLIFAMA